MVNLGMPEFPATAAATLAAPMARGGGPQPGGDCAPVWMPPKTSTADAHMHSPQATEAVAPTLGDLEPTAAQTRRGEWSEAGPDRRRGRDPTATTGSNPWENALTCGWVSGVSSYPWTCADAWHCETNAGHAVGCVSGTYSPLYTECYDYMAWTNGLCSDTDSLTGCCESSQKPACVTYLWPGTPRRSMFRCGAGPALTSMLDAPQYVLDASASSASRASANSTTISASPPPGPTRALPTETMSSPSPTGDAGAAPHLGAFFIGGLVVFALLLVLGGGTAAALYLRRAHRPGRTAADALELRDTRPRGTVEAGSSSGPHSTTQGVSTTHPRPTPRGGEGWAARAWGRWKKAVGR